MLTHLNRTTYIPTEWLRPFIKTYLIIESQEVLLNRVLPDTSLVIAFRYQGQVNYVTDHSVSNLPSSVISGLRKSARLIQYAQDTGNILVLFKEAGVRAFFKKPLHELYGESVSLDNFVPQHVLSTIEEQLAEAQNNQQRISIVDQFFLSRWRDSTPDKLISAAIQKIYAANGLLPIKELANTLYMSHDAFEKRFRKVVGTSPKQFSSVVRLKAIINQRALNLKLTDLALEAGYFDQAHFNKAFKLFTGQTPTDFFKSPLFW